MAGNLRSAHMRKLIAASARKNKRTARMLANARKGHSIPLEKNFICDNTPTKAILLFLGCSEVNSTRLITSELANQRARKVLFTCVVYTNRFYMIAKLMRAL